jgi:CSLREA domain-containing protein
MKTTDQKTNHIICHRMNLSILLALLLSLGLALALALPVRSAALSTYTVNSTNDVNDGTCDATHCSLREAINAANANAGADTILFNISSGCSGGICTIKPATNLPALSSGSDTIDGSTSANKIELNGSLIVSGGIGLRISSANNVIRGLVINRFNDAGIEISGSDNVIEGNFIGTDISGYVGYGNGDGVRISSNGNRVGGTTLSQRNLISANDRGVRIFSSANNQIQGNYIGIDVDGGALLGNAYQGVLIEGAATGNVIGGDTTSQRNVISANEIGVEISGSSTHHNTVGANYIGTGANGTADLGNILYGVSLKDGANYNTIGGYTGSPRNVISGNGSHGVFISGSGTNHNTVSGNYIGVNKDGSVAMGNGGDGVIIRLQAAYNTIGGDSAPKRNVISGNSENGVEIYLDSSFNKVTGNYIGLNWNATGGLGNSLNGVLIVEGSHGNTIGGDHNLGLGNVISMNLANGVLITGTGTDTNTVAGNYIGVNAAGTNKWSNGESGVKIEAGAMYNTIGDALSSGEGNVISGNDDCGVFIDGSASAQNKVLGNIIGLSASGSGVWGNGSDGIFINDAPDNMIGTSSLYGNIITGNEGNGVTIDGANASGNLVAGNYIGVDISGSSGLGNDENGVLIFNGAHDNIIGTVVNDGRNVISGNGWSGVAIEGSTTQHNTVTYNYIGTDEDGNMPLSNHAQGVLVHDALNNTIGSATLYQGNIISGNILNGVHLNGAVGNTVIGNYIGVDVLGYTPMANGANGVSLSNGAVNNVIGGDTAGKRNVISGNAGNGISIFGNGTANNAVSGNYIGLDAGGANSLPNGEDGIWIGDQASGNTIGGSTASQRNVISGNTWNGVSVMDGATLNIVSGNYIGVNNDGVTMCGNGYNGVSIEDASDNTIGGDVAGERNVISENDWNGISIEGSSASNNIVSGNYIGVDSTGGSASPNQNSGVWIGNSASNNTIGGDAVGERNVISGNRLHGVALGSGTGQTTVIGNYIGLSSNGSIALGNGGTGVLILNSGSNSIGGSVAGDRNIICGNNSHGILISGSASMGNNVIGNYIGLDSSGAIAFPNGSNGVMLANGAHGNTIGGNVAGKRNVISGNSQNGVQIDGSNSTGNVVSGNYIGLKASGDSALYNFLNGVMLSNGANGNTIGGDASGERNVISGNSQAGVRIEGIGASGNIVSGNYIGLNATGTAALPNLSYGVSIGGSASGNTVGGDVPGERNVISGNHLFGVLIESGASLNTVSGNYIGVTPAGDAALSNDGGGIKVDSAAQNVIGGDVAGERNVISGNTSNGIWINGSAATGNVVSGNYIGLAANGSSILANAGNGIIINGAAASNTIGGSTSAEANTISGNSQAGVVLGSNLNLVKWNYIGTDNKGADPAGNGSYGVWIFGSMNTIGPSNVIAFNAGDGVEVNGSTATNNRITQNNIFSNAMGIDLVDGANGGILPPVIHSITYGIGVVHINGTTCSACLVEVFGNPDADGEGKIYLGSAVATAGGAFTVDAPSLGSAAALTATAFDSHKGTSEFSGQYFMPGKNLFLPLLRVEIEKPLAQAQPALPSTAGDRKAPAAPQADALALALALAALAAAWMPWKTG